MRLYFAIIIIALNFALVFGQEAKFHFDQKTTVKLGKFNEGEIVKHTYTFTNQGDIPLIINEAKVSCTCTKIEFPKEPVLPNQAGEITIIFDTNKTYYWQDRTVTIYANTKRPQKLRFKLYVEPKDS